MSSQTRTSSTSDNAARVSTDSDVDPSKKVRGRAIRGRSTCIRPPSPEVTGCNTIKDVTVTESAPATSDAVATAQRNAATTRPKQRQTKDEESPESSSSTAASSPVAQKPEVTGCNTIKDVTVTESAPATSDAVATAQRNAATTRPKQRQTKDEESPESSSSTAASSPVAQKPTSKPSAVAASTLTASKSNTCIVSRDMLFLASIADSLTTSDLKRAKFLFHGDDSTSFALPASELEPITDGRELILALRRRIPEYADCLRLLHEVLYNLRLETVASRIKKELDKVNSGKDHGTSDETEFESDTLTKLKAVPEKYLEMKPLTSNASKCAYLLSSGEIVVEIRLPKCETLVFSMPVCLWQKVLNNADHIETMQRTFEKTNVKISENISGDTYLRVDRYKGFINISLRRFYRDFSGELQPSIIGINVQHKTWTKFMDFLQTSVARLTPSGNS